MQEWEFTLIVDGDLMTEPVIDKLALDDATLGVSNGVPYADFYREAESFPRAVVSAIQDLERVPGLSVLRVEPDDLVSLSDIAERFKWSREYVRLLAMGERGDGSFPVPISHLMSRSRLWRWYEVAAWAGRLSEDELENARFLSVANGLLQARRAGTLREADQRLVRELLPA